MNNPGSASPGKSIHTSNYEGDNSHGIISLSSQHEKMNQVSATSFAYVGSLSSNKARAGSHTDIFGSNRTFAFKTHDSEVEALKILARLNPHDDGLCWYLRLREQRENEDSAETQSRCYLWYLGRYKSSTRSIFSSSTIQEY